MSRYRHGRLYRNDSTTFSCPARARGGRWAAAAEQYKSECGVSSRMDAAVLAAVGRNPMAAEVLVRNGAAANTAPAGYGSQNAMYHTAASEHVVVVDVLIWMGCDKGAIDLSSVDEVRSATLFRQWKVVERFIGVAEFPLTEGGGDGDCSRVCWDSWLVTATDFHVRNVLKQWPRLLLSGLVSQLVHW